MMIIRINQPPSSIVSLALEALIGLGKTSWKDELHDTLDNILSCHLRH